MYKIYNTLFRNDLQIFIFIVRQLLYVISANTSANFSIIFYYI